mgnify:CR=1 FL=1
MTVALLVRIPQSDLLHPHRAGQASRGVITLSQEPEPRPPAPPGTDPGPVAGLSAEQQSWLDLNTKTYGASFDRDKWVESLLQQNRRAVQGRGLGPPAPVPAPRPPSPAIPPMPAFPVAPSSQDPGEYAKYKRDYDAYTEWYNKYSQKFSELTGQSDSLVRTEDSIKLLLTDLDHQKGRTLEKPLINLNKHFKETFK